MSPDRYRIIEFPVTDREYDVLAALSIINDEPISSVVITALAEHLKRQIKDPEFSEKLSIQQAEQDNERNQLLHDLGIGDIPDGDYGIDSTFRQ